MHPSNNPSINRQSIHVCVIDQSIFHLSLYLSINPSIHQSLNQSVNLSPIHPSITQFWICQSVYVCVSVLAIRLVCLATATFWQGRLSIWSASEAYSSSLLSPDLGLKADPSIHPPIHPSITQFWICQSVYVCVCLCLPLGLLVWPLVHFGRADSAFEARQKLTALPFFRLT